MISLTLPLGPTINHYFARNGNRTYLPAKVREYRDQVAEIVAEAGHQTLEGRLSVFMAVHMPTKRRADIDNRIKGCLDAMMHAGVFLDDEQIDELTLVRKEIIKGGLVRVVIAEI